MNEMNEQIREEKTCDCCGKKFIALTDKHTSCSVMCAIVMESKDNTAIADNNYNIINY